MVQGRVSHPDNQLAERLVTLYQQQLAIRPSDAYLQEHAAARFVQAQAAVFDFYSEYFPSQGKVLDWGCRHAPDACLLRTKIGPDLAIDGCDFVEAGTYSIFHDYAGLRYRFLDSVYQLPYDDNQFDAIIASGTLEHAAMDYESLKELYRVLKVDGRLIITYLPNRLSYEEWYKRRVQRKGFHRRLYGLGEVVRLLKRTGFYPHTAGYQTHLDMLPPRLIRHHLLRSLRWLVPLHWFSSTICVVADKVHAM